MYALVANKEIIIIIIIVVACARRAFVSVAQNCGNYLFQTNYSVGILVCCLDNVISFACKSFFCKKKLISVSVYEHFWTMFTYGEYD